MGKPTVVEAGTVPRIGASVVFGDVDCLGVPIKMFGTDCVSGDLAPGMLVDPLCRPGIVPMRSGGRAGVGIGLVCGGSPLGGRGAIGSSPADGLTAAVEATSTAATGAAEV